jgi:hypothetical protein
MIDAVLLTVDTDDFPATMGRRAISVEKMHPLYCEITVGITRTRIAKNLQLITEEWRRRFREEMS